MGQAIEIRCFGPAISSSLPPRPEDGTADRSPGDLANSARGWHGVQLGWLQVTAGVLAVAALVVSCLSIFVVARVAWPFSSRVVGGDVPQSEARRLRKGIALTSVAVGLMALAASSSWWPTPGAADLEGAGATVRITD